MNIQGSIGIAKIHSAYGQAAAKPGPTALETKALAQTSGTQVTMSDQAKAMTRDDSIAARMEAIKAKPALQRSSEEFAFVQNNDKRLAELLARDPNTHTAEEVSYVQKASGFVNTMAHLTSQEKQLYDELASKGEVEALRGLGLIAMSRTQAGNVELPGGLSFNPGTTEVSADNVRQLFSRLFAGDREAQDFAALASYLDRKPA